MDHTGNGMYFFSRNDLAELQKANPDGRFLVADFIPERQSSQRRSYVGIDETQEDRSAAIILSSPDLTTVLLT